MTLGLSPGLGWQLLTQPHLQAGAAWVWDQVIVPSQWSLAAAVPGLIGYYLLGEKRRGAWVFLLVSQALLVVTGLVSREYGLLVVIAYAAFGAWNWLKWRRDRQHGVPAWLSWLVHDHQRLLEENARLWRDNATLRGVKVYHRPAPTGRPVALLEERGAYDTSDTACPVFPKGVRIRIVQRAKSGPRRLP